MPRIPEPAEPAALSGDAREGEDGPALAALDQLAREGTAPRDTGATAPPGEVAEAPLDDSVRQYLREIGQVPLLSPDQELALAADLAAARCLGALGAALEASLGRAPGPAELWLAIYRQFRDAWPAVQAVHDALAPAAPAPGRGAGLAALLPTRVLATTLTPDALRGLADRLGTTPEGLDETIRRQAVALELLPRRLRELVDQPAGWPDEAGVAALLEEEGARLGRRHARLLDAGRRAERQLAAANLRLVVSVARRYARPAVPLLDLVQEGSLGLLRAVEKFDHHRGYRFSTYATWWIRQAVTRALADQARTIRLPVHLAETLAGVRRAERRLRQELGREPRAEELAGALALPVGRVEELRKVMQEPVSLHRPVGDEETELGELLPDEGAIEPGEAAEEGALRDQVERALGILGERERTVLALRFGLAGERGRTLEEVGQLLGVTRERVRQIEAKALRKLRHPRHSDPLREYLA